MPHKVLFQYQRQASPLFVEAAPETITLDKWEPKLPSLLFQKKWSRPTENYTFFTSLADLRVPTDWIQPISTPLFRPAYRQQQVFYTPIVIDSGVICVDLQVSASEDDCGLGAAGFDNTATGHIVGYTGLFTPNEMATRWVSGGFDLADLIGATIFSATVILKAASTTSGSITAHLHFEDADNPSAITDATDFSTRQANVTTGVEWTFPDTILGQNYESPNLAVSLQEVIDRPGFTGDALNLFHHVHGGELAFRTWLTFDNAPTDAAILRICYTPAANTSYLLDWLQPLSQPQKPSAGLVEAPGAYPPIFPILPPPEITLDKWYTPIQQPIFRPAPLRQSQITVCLPESTFATVTIITRVALQFTAPRNLLDFTTTTNDLDYTAPNEKLDYTADDF